MYKSLRDDVYAAKQHERLMAAMRRKREMVDVEYEIQTKVTDKAVLFPSYGWIPKVSIRWRLSDGSVVPWDCGRAGDQMMIDRYFLK